MVQSPRYTHQQLRDYALMVSIEHHLCQVDELVESGKSADDILQMVAAGDDTIVIWEHYEWEDANDLVELIEDERGVNLYNFEHVLEQTNGESWFADFKETK
jgi:predicted amino acid racemase